MTRLTNPFGQCPTATPVTQADPRPVSPPPLPAKWSATVTMPPSTLSVWVEGDPKPQGSKDYKGKRRNGSAILVESADVGPWRDRVERAVRATGVRIAGPVSVGLDFHLRRPARPKYPDVPAGKPDLDKLARAVLDALESAEAVEDDARVVEFHHLAKHWAAPGGAGVLITVRKVTRP